MDERIEAAKLLLIIAIAIAAGALVGCATNTDRYWSSVSTQIGAAP